ncbi:hypothetical protein HKD37_20G056848 [Glycine soja]
MVLRMVFPLRCEPKQNCHFHSILSQTAQTPSLVGVRHLTTLHGHRDGRPGAINGTTIAVVSGGFVAVLAAMLSLTDPE